MIFEKRLWFVLDAIVLVLLLLSARLAYWQLVRGDDLLPSALSSNPLAEGDAGIKKITRGDQELRDLLTGSPSLEDLQDLPQPVVQRLSDLLETITRGAIYDRNGRLLASDQVDEQGNRIRFYSEPGLAHVVGQVSGLRLGISGLESAYNAQLLGLDRPDAAFDRMLHRPAAGSDLILTIDSDLQRAAEQALDGRAGSITILDAHSGAVLAMASLPGYDPNRFLEEGYLSGLLESCEALPAEAQSTCRGFLLNRATQALYPPGSTWKTVTLIAALDSGHISPDFVFDFGQPVQGADGPYYVYAVDGGVIPDPNHAESRLSLELSFAKSANAAFARMGDEMPPETLIDYAARLGFSTPVNARFPLEFDYSHGQLAQDVNSLYANNLLRAATAIGQGELLTSPLNMGMVVLSVLNDGNLPLPYLVEGIRDPGDATARQPERAVVPGIMRPETAQIVRNMLVSVVTQGSGRRAALDGLTVGGKTGTAQVGGDRPPHAWFAGFASDAERTVVIVVMIENGGEGSETAAPVFAQMAQAALQTAGEPVTEPPTPTPTLTPAPLAEEPTPTPVLEATQPAATDQPVATDQPAEEIALTPTPLPGAEGLPPPDIPYDPDKVDFTERGAATCPGNQQGPVGSGQFIWPSVYQALSGDDFRPGHPGIDLSAPSGTAVYAADDGLVIFAGWTGIGYGNTVVIDHGNGYKTLYAHLSQISQHCGAKVQAGKVIGLSGDTGNSYGPHLHFEVRVPGGYLNPLRVLPVP